MFNEIVAIELSPANQQVPANPNPVHRQASANSSTVADSSPTTDSSATVDSTALADSSATANPRATTDDSISIENSVDASGKTVQVVGLGSSSHGITCSHGYFVMAVMAGWTGKVKYTAARHGAEEKAARHLDHQLEDLCPSANLMTSNVAPAVMG